MKVCGAMKGLREELLELQKEQKELQDSLQAHQTKCLILERKVQQAKLQQEVNLHQARNKALEEQLRHLRDHLEASRASLGNLERQEPAAPAPEAPPPPGAPPPPEDPPPPEALPDGWEERVSKSTGQIYFYNRSRYPQGCQCRCVKTSSDNCFPRTRS